MILILLSILTPLIILGVFIGVTILYFRIRIQQTTNEKGTLLGKIDLNTRKIFVYNNKINKGVPKRFFDVKNIEKWESINELLKAYKGDKTERIVRNLLVKMGRGEEFVKDEFVIKAYSKKDNAYTITITMYKLDDSTDIGIIMSWSQIKEEEKTKSASQLPLTKSDVASMAFEYKGFVAFQLKNYIDDASKEFMEQISQIYKYKYKYTNYFITNGLLVFVFGAAKASKAKGKVLKFISVLKTKGIKIGINRMYNGTSWAVVKEVNTPKRINNVLELLYFNINLSIRTGKSFINKEIEEFDLTEYKIVAEGIKTFRQAIKTKDIKLSEIVVKNEETNRKIMVYTYPQIKGVTNEVQSIILRDPDNVESLIDVYSKMVSIDNFINKPALVDINNTWLRDHHNSMTYKKAIYIINYNQYKKADTNKIIHNMVEKNFTFAIRVKIFNEEMTTIIKRVKPQFLVIDKTLSEVKRPENYIQLLAIKKMADQQKIRLIFENPSDKVDSSMSKVLGIKYVYRF